PKRQHISSIGTGALGKKHYYGSRGQPLFQFVAYPLRIRPSLTVQEKRSGHVAERAEQRPAFNLLLGNESARHNGAHDEDVEIAHMIADDHSRGRRHAIALILDPESRQHLCAPMVQPLGASHGLYPSTLADP